MRDGYDSQDPYGAAVLRAIVDDLLKGRISSKRELEARKKDAATILGLGSLPGNARILAQALPGERESLRMLIRKPTRTLSGVAVIAAMTSPARCPHGRCLPCPGGAQSPCPTPQSYTGREPAALRAAQHTFHPYLQVRARLAQLEEIGHPVEKAELIVMGGTITSRPLGYQAWFVNQCLQAMNDHPRMATGLDDSGNREVPTAEGNLLGTFGTEAIGDGYGRTPRTWKPFSCVARENALARVKNVGITFETRPDWCLSDHIKQMLSLGATKVELGVQSLRDPILQGMRRGHTVKDTARATHLLREAGLKVGYHMMPGLPGSSFEEDLEEFQTLFADQRFRPDYLKIYPTLVVGGTDLEIMYAQGLYHPIGDEDAAELVSRIKELIPPYCRLQRVQRDIPSSLILAGVKKSNLRQIAAQRLEERGVICQCIRCREAGLRRVEGVEASPRVFGYRAGEGREIFVSFEAEGGYLVGFLRLRFGGQARVRELHVYGPLVPPGKRGGWQHQGFGARLLREAEAIAAEEGYPCIYITSGLGVRNYYRELGYRLEEPYMVKYLGRSC